MGATSHLRQWDSLWLGESRGGTDEMQTSLKCVHDGYKPVSLAVFL